MVLLGGGTGCDRVGEREVARGAERLLVLRVSNEFALVECVDINQQCILSWMLYTILGVLGQLSGKHSTGKGRQGRGITTNGRRGVQRRAMKQRAPQVGIQVLAPLEFCPRWDGKVRGRRKQKQIRRWA